MCEVIVINLGEKQIATPREFLDHFGFMPEVDPDFDEEKDMDFCLCGCDMWHTFKVHNIEFEYDGDWYVGKLENYKRPKIG